MIKSVPALAFRSALLFSFLAAPFAVFSGMGITVIFILFSLPLLPLAIKKYGAVVAAKSIAPPVSLFFLWIIITCLWSPDYYNAAVLWVLVCLLMLLATISIRFLAEITEEQRQKIARFTLFGFLLAAMIYAEEIFSKGFLVSNFRELLAGGGK